MPPTRLMSSTQKAQGVPPRRVHAGTRELGSQAAQPVLEVRSDGRTDGQSGDTGSWRGVSRQATAGAAHLSPANLPVGFPDKGA